MDNAEDFIDEMDIKFKQSKRAIPIQTKYLGYLRDFSTLLAFIQNLLYIIFAYRSEDLRETLEPHWLYNLAYVIGALQLIFSSASIIMHIYLNGNLIINMSWRKYIREKKSSVKLEELNNQTIDKLRRYGITTELTSKILLEQGPDSPIF